MDCLVYLVIRCLLYILAGFLAEHRYLDLHQLVGEAGITSVSAVAAAETPSFRGEVRGRGLYQAPTVRVVRRGHRTTLVLLFGC